MLWEKTKAKNDESKEYQQRGAGQEVSPDIQIHSVNRLSLAGCFYALLTVVNGKTLDVDIAQSIVWDYLTHQGLAVLMASAVVVLKHETSTIRQRHNFISIDMTFGVSDYIREVTSDKVRWAVETPRGGNIFWRVLWLFLFFLFVFIFFKRATAHTREPIVAHNSSKDADWCKEHRFGMISVLFWNLRVFCPNNTPKIGRKGELPAKIK